MPQGGIHHQLKITDPQKKREELKNKAVEMREKGNLKIALGLFEQVEQWDFENKSYRGLVDVLGHIRITYTRLGDEAKKKADQIKYYGEAVKAIEQAFHTAEQHPKEIPEGSMAILKIHQASSLLAYASVRGKQSQIPLKRALAKINQAIKVLPGSQAHKAWPANTKARILYAMGKVDEALQVLADAEVWLAQGYNDEKKKDDQFEIKMNVWKSGLDLARAEIMLKENKPILAKHYANAVASLNDPSGTLGERKKEAKRILAKLKNV